MNCCFANPPEEQNQPAGSSPRESLLDPGSPTPEHLPWKCLGNGLNLASGPGPKTFDEQEASGDERQQPKNPNGKRESQQNVESENEQKDRQKKMTHG